MPKKIVVCLMVLFLVLICLPASADSYSDMMEKAESYISSKDYEKARGCYQLAQKLQPEKEEAFLGEANVLILDQDYASALSVLNRVLDEFPVSPLGWAMRCKIDVLLDDVSAFEQDLVYAEICESDLSDLNLSVADMYISDGQFEKAIDFYERGGRKISDEEKVTIVFRGIVKRFEKINDYLEAAFSQGPYIVTDISWARAIPVDHIDMYSESGWILPEGAILTSQQEELHHYDQKLDHYEDVEVQRSRQIIDHYETYYTYEDNGEGTFTEIPHKRPVYTTEYYMETVSSPVYIPIPCYQTKYYYNILRGTLARVEKSSGSDHNVFWPELTMTDEEQEGTPRSEIYVFTIKNGNNETVSYEVTKEFWRYINVGSHLNIVAGYFGENAWIVDGAGNKITSVYRR